MKNEIIEVTARRCLFRTLPRQILTGAKGLLNTKMIAVLPMIAVLCMVGFSLSTTKAGAQEWRSYRPYQREGLPIDGVWILSIDGTRVSIRDGRSFNERTGAPMGRDIHEIGPGRFAQQDFVCHCRANMKLTLDGALLGVSHSIIGPGRWELHPVHLDHPRWFRYELHVIGDNN